MEHMFLKDISGDVLDLHADEVVNIEGHFGVQLINHGPVSYAGNGYEYIIIKTKSGEHKIPRNAENDKEILSFMLSRPCTNHNRSKV